MPDAELVDRSQVLDAWVDPDRRTRILLHPLSGPFRDRGFVASAHDADGHVVNERYFVLRTDSVQALGYSEARRALRSTSRSLIGRLLGVGLALTLAGCGGVTNTIDPASTGEGGQASTDASSQCEPIPPSQLPSGAAPGEPVVTRTGPEYTVVWGSGSNKITQAVGWFGLGSNDDFPPADAAETTIRDTTGYLQTTEELPTGSAVISWAEGACLYTIWLEPGFSEDKAIEYASQF